MKLDNEKMEALLQESAEATTEAFTHVLDKYFKEGDLVDFRAMVQIGATALIAAAFARLKAAQVPMEAVAEVCKAANKLSDDMAKDLAQCFEVLLAAGKIRVVDGDKTEGEA